MHHEHIPSAEAETNREAQIAQMAEEMRAILEEHKADFQLQMAARLSRVR